MPAAGFTMRVMNGVWPAFLPIGALALLLFGCPRSAPEPPAETGGESPSATPEPTPPGSTPAPAPTSAASSAPPAPAADGWIGSWASASCGPRAYRREVTFAADGTVKGRDLVSPCPKGAACVWSGIVDWKGTYTAAEGKLALAVKIDGGPRGQLTLPTELGWDAEAKAVVETADGSRCVYESASP